MTVAPNDVVVNAGESNSDAWLSCHTQRMPGLVIHAPYLGEFHVPGAVHVGVASPEVFAGKVGNGHLDALVPKMIVRPVRCDHFSC